MNYYDIIINIMKINIDRWNKYFNKEVNYFPIINSFCVSKENRKKLLRNILRFSEINKFSKYNRKKVWFDVPEEKIVEKYCFSDNSYIAITIFNKISKRYNIFYYSDVVLSEELMNKIILKIKLPKTKNYTFTCFKKPRVSGYREFVIWKTKINRSKSNNLVFEFSKLNKDIQKTINNLVQDKTLEGFEFLIKKLSKIKSPVFCLVLKSKIQGLIGPANVFYDADENKITSSFYFGVNERHRKNGYGKTLFRHFINFCYFNNIKYFLVTNGKDSIASKFYKKMRAKIGNKYYRIEKKDIERQ